MKKAVFFLIVVFFAAFTAVRASFAADSLGVRANYSYSGTESSSSGITTTSKSSAQQYGVNFSKDLTTTISLSGTMSWNITEVNGKKQETSYPFLILQFNPPALYDIRFSHSRTETDPSEGVRITTTNTSAAFSLPETKWPGANISYNISTMEDHESPKNADSVSSNVTLGMNKGFYFLDTSARAGYIFTQGMSEDKVSKTKSENPSHSVNADISRSFLENNLSVSANLGYQTSESTTESTGAPSLFPVVIQGNTGWAYNPTYSVPLTVLTNGLVDGNTTAAVPFGSGNTCGLGATIDLNCANWNIGMGFLFPRSIDKIYVYINTTMSDTTAPFTGYNFGWQVYTSSNNITWALIATPAQVYNASLNRFELSFTPTSAQYFKVVNTAGNGSPTPINVTEIEAVGNLLTTPKQSVTQEFSRQSGGLSLSYRPIERLSLGFSLNYDTAEQGAVEGGTGSESINKSYGLNANYLAIPRYLNISGNFNNTSSESKSTVDTESATGSYSFSLSSSPLDTVNLGLTYNHAESETNGERVSQAESTAINSGLMLYRGVDLGLSVAMASSESFQSDTRSDSTSYNVNLRLVPWQRLTITMNNSHTSATTEAPAGKSSTKSASTSANFSFTPTRRIYLSGRFNLEPTESQSYNMTLLPTQKIQVSLNYNNDNTSKTVSMGGNLNWQVLKPLSVGVVYSITSVDNATDDETQTILARGSISF